MRRRNLSAPFLHDSMTQNRVKDGGDSRLIRIKEDAKQ